MTAFRALIILSLLTTFSCGRKDDNTNDLSSENELLEQSLNEYYGSLNSAVDFVGYGHRLPLELRSKFDFLKSGLSTTSKFQQSHRDTLNKVSEQIEYNKHYFYKTDLELCRAHISGIKFWSESTLDGRVGHALNELLRLEKLIISTDLRRSYYSNLTLLDSFAVKVVPESNVIKLGSPYRARVYYVAYATAPTLDVLLYEKIDTVGARGIGFIDTIPVKRGQDPMIEFYPTKLGKQSISVLWPWEVRGTDRSIRWIAETEFIVEK